MPTCDWCPVQTAPYTDRLTLNTWGIIWYLVYQHTPGHWGSRWPSINGWSGSSWSSFSSQQHCVSPVFLLDNKTSWFSPNFWCTWCDARRPNSVSLVVNFALFAGHRRSKTFPKTGLVLLEPLDLCIYVTFVLLIRAVDWCPNRS